MYDDLYKEVREILKDKRFISIEKLSAVRLNVAAARSEALQALFEARPELLRPKDKDVTDLDRKTQMEAWTAQKEHDYVFLCDLWTILDDVAKSLGKD